MEEDKEERIDVLQPAGALRAFARRIPEAFARSKLKGTKLKAHRVIAKKVRPKPVSTFADRMATFFDLYEHAGYLKDSKYNKLTRVLKVWNLSDYFLKISLMSHSS